MSENKRAPIEATVAELKPGMKRVNITFKVMNTSDERSVESRKDGEMYRVQDAVVGDSTGTVQMPIWNENIDTMNEGDTYTLTNGYAGLFKGSLRLHIGKFGLVTSADIPIVEVNSQLDMSAKDYGLGSRSS
ncbi:single-stranded DNA-binding protein [Candidatus Thorarchaeota archaeon]|nr:MAG: single-stranded DNA-binding protein [Candidatus Thorarchaeota archaeon]